MENAKKCIGCLEGQLSTKHMTLFDKTQYMIECDKCHRHTAWHPSYEEAIYAWNYINDLTSEDVR